MPLHLPTLNASLNATSAILLLGGFISIKTKHKKAHILFMLGATLCSVVFLTSYLYYHYHHGSTPFQGQGLIRPFYFTLLIFHTILAVTLLPFVIVTLFRASKQQFDLHVKVARITWPIWMIVSVTGVIVYWMLYKL